jgi:hypothetical protein
LGRAAPDGLPDASSFDGGVWRSSLRRSRLDPSAERVPLVRAGVGFKDGVRVEREDGQVPVLTRKRLAATKEKRGKIAA